MQQKYGPFRPLGTVFGLQKSVQARPYAATVDDMPRANRLSVEVGIFHLTHRCHDQAFHLRCARDCNL